jgi:predicted DNA-binding protein
MKLAFSAAPAPAKKKAIVQMTEKSEYKITQSYRVTPELREVLRKTAEETDCAQGTIIEECVRASIDEVRDRLLVQRKKDLDAKELAESQKPPKRPVGRPKKSS